MVIFMERLQKVIAASGIASRRKAEELILAKKVKVNGEVVSELGVKVSEKDEVLVNGVKINREEKYIIYLINLVGLLRLLVMKKEEIQLFL